MANPAHEALLRQGVEEWNRWRASNASVTPDLTSVNMSAASLAGADLSHARLRGAKLIRARLEGCDMRYADLRDAQLHEADLSDADLFRADLQNALLPGAKLRRSRLYGADLRGAQITVADLRKADLREARLDGADLRESHGGGASLERASLKDAELRGCYLAGSNLAGASGLERRQLEAAILDETTALPESLGGAPAERSLESLLRSLESLKARSNGPAVSETEIAAYNLLLEALSARGIEIERARVLDSELVRPVTSWERTAGGEAFETSPMRWLTASVFRERIDSLLSELRPRLERK